MHGSTINKMQHALGLLATAHYGSTLNRAAYQLAGPVARKRSSSFYT